VNLTRAQFESISRAAKATARKGGYGHLADDFAQEACIALARGRKASIDQLFVDFLRTEYGRTGVYSTPGGRAKAAARHGSVEFNTELHQRSTLDTPDAGLDGACGDQEFERLFRIARVVLDEFELAVFEAAYGQLKPQAEIGEQIGVSASRVSQILAASRAEIRDEVDSADMLALLQDDAPLELEVLWIAV
jgi:RNA polymerase sigma factor (sigma-70 family)